MKIFNLLTLLFAFTALSAQEVVSERISNLNPENYEIEGDAILRTYDDGRLELSLTDDFDTPQGPDVRIYLNTSTSLGGIEIVDLSSINHFSGAYSVDVPSGVDIEDYDFIVFFCVAFNQSWASGQFGETTIIGGGFECLDSSTSASEGANSVSVCPTETTASVIFTNSINAAAGENYAYLITDENDVLQHVVTTNSFDFAGSGESPQRVYGVSYAGELNAPIGANRLQTTAADCIQHSSGTEYLTVLKNGCDSYECRDQATATTDWVAVVDVCAGDGISDEVELRNSLSISTEAHYAYLLTMEDETLLEVVYDTFYNFENSGPVNLRVYGINFDGELMPEIGANRMETTATGCFTHSSADLYLTILKGGTCASATFDAELAKNVTAYPVPASDVLNVTFPADFSPQSLRVTDLNGRLVIEQDGLLSGNVQINVSRFIPGTYFLQLWDENRAVSKRVSILR